MTTTLEKVQRLINLTASDNVNEAKTAALQACRIIREKKLELREPPSGTATFSSVHGRDAARVDFNDDFSSNLNDYLRDFETLFGAGTFRNVGRQARPAPKPPPQPPKYPKARPECTVGSRGACHKCGEQIPAGTMFIAWPLASVTHYFHPECYPGERW